MRRRDWSTTSPGSSCRVPSASGASAANSLAGRSIFMRPLRSTRPQTPRLGPRDRQSCPDAWGVYSAADGWSVPPAPQAKSSRGPLDPPEASASNATDATGLPGQTLVGRFRVEKVLGHGGMGEVLLAHDTLLNRAVALKRLRSDGEEGVARRRAILKEARRASQVSDRRIAA